MKDCVESCQLEISEEELIQNLTDVVNTFGQKPLAFGRTTEGDIAFLYRAFGLLRNDLNAIRVIGTGFSPMLDGREMIPLFGKKMVLRFVEDISMYFRRRKKAFSPAKNESATLPPDTKGEAGMEDKSKRPTVFISYSHDDHQDLVRSIVDRLISEGGINVIFDDYDLHLGHDVNKFMERTVNDPEMSKVLIMCDRSYREKADARRGGVGTETIIISQEVYSQSSPGKFIPVVLERDENGEAYRPVFLKHSNYIDLSQEGIFEENFRKLVCEIYGKPFRKKPPLGPRPDYVTDEGSGRHEAVARPMQHGSSNAKGGVPRFDEAVRMSIEALDALSPKTFANGNARDMDALTLPIRNNFLGSTQAAFESGTITEEDIGDAIEKMHGEVSPLKGCSSYRNEDYAYLDGFFHELFICLVGLLLEREAFAGLHGLLWRTYFLRRSWFDIDPPKPCSYTAFRKACSAFSWALRSPGFHGNSEANRSGMFESRELKPYWTAVKIQKADLFLFQMSEFKNRDSENRAEIWLPVTATHYGDSPRMGWDRLVSKRHCRRMLPLFGQESIEELKVALGKTASASKRNHWDTLAYDWVLGGIPDITREIPPDEIGSME